MFTGLPSDCHLPEGAMNFCDLGCFVGFSQLLTFAQEVVAMSFYSGTEANKFFAALTMSGMKLVQDEMVLLKQAVKEAP